jgi:hypothetical protein
VDAVVAISAAPVAVVALSAAPAEVVAVVAVVAASGGAAVAVA